MTQAEWDAALAEVDDYCRRRRGFLILADGVPLDRDRTGAMGGYEFVTVYPTWVAAKDAKWEYHNGRARMGLTPDEREFSIVRVMFPAPVASEALQASR